MVLHAPQEEEVASLSAMAEKLKDPGTVKPFQPAQCNTDIESDFYCFSYASYRIHCLCCLHCREQPGSDVHRRASLRSEERASVHPHLLCDRLTVRVLRERPRHRH